MSARLREILFSYILPSVLTLVMSVQWAHDAEADGQEEEGV